MELPISDLELSLNNQHDLYKCGKLTGAEFSRQIMSIEWANAGADRRFEAFIAEYPTIVGHI